MKNKGMVALWEFCTVPLKSVKKLTNQVLLISLAFEHCVLRATFDPH